MFFPRRDFSFESEFKAWHRNDNFAAWNNYGLKTAVKETVLFGKGLTVLYLSLL